MNEQISIRQSILDEIDSVTMESSSMVLDSLMNSANKMMTIMENFEGDVDNVSIFYQESDDPNHPFKESSTIKTILMFIPNLILFISKQIKRLFSPESAKTTHSAGSKMKSIAGDIKDSVGSFLSTGEIPTPVKIGGVVISGAALTTLMALFNNKFKGFVKTFIDKIRAAFNKIKDFVTGTIKGIDPEAVWDVAKMAESVNGDSAEAFRQGLFWCVGEDSWMSILDPANVEAFYKEGNIAFSSINNTLGGINSSNNTSNEIVKTLNEAKKGIAKAMKTRPINSEAKNYSEELIVKMLTFLGETSINDERDKIAKEIATKLGSLTNENKIDKAISKELKALNELVQGYSNVAINLAMILKAFEFLHDNVAGTMSAVEEIVKQANGESQKTEETDSESATDEESGADAAAESTTENKERATEEKPTESEKVFNKGDTITDEEFKSLFGLKSKDLSSWEVYNLDPTKAKAKNKDKVENRVKVLNDNGYTLGNGVNNLKHDVSNKTWTFEYSAEDFEEFDDELVQEYADPIAASWYTK